MSRPNFREIFFTKLPCVSFKIHSLDFYSFLDKKSLYLHVIIQLITTTKILLIYSVFKFSWFKPSFWLNIFLIKMLICFTINTTEKQVVFWFCLRVAQAIATWKFVKLTITFKINTS